MGEHNSDNNEVADYPDHWHLLPAWREGYEILFDSLEQDRKDIENLCCCCERFGGMGSSGIAGVLVFRKKELGYICETCWEEFYDPYPLEWVMDGGEVYELCSPEGAPERQRLVAEGRITQEEANALAAGRSWDVSMAKLQFATHGYWPDWRRRAGEARK